MDYTKVVVAANSARSYKLIYAVLQFINAYPSEEGKKAKRAYYGIIISTLVIIFCVMMPLIIGAVLYFDGEPDMPEGAKYKRVAVCSTDQEDKFSLYVNPEVEYNVSDYTDQKFDKGEFFYVYLNEEGEVIAMVSTEDIEDQEDPLGMFLLLGMLILPITLLLGNALIGRVTYFKWWRLYCNWYTYEIAPLVSQSNFHELVKDKKYYNVLIKTSVLGDEDKKLYKRYNGLAIAGGISIVLGLIITTVIDTLLKLKFGLEAATGLVWIIYFILVFALCFFIMHFDKKAREVKEKYIKKNG